MNPYHHVQKFQFDKGGKFFAVRTHHVAQKLTSRGLSQLGLISCLIFVSSICVARDIVLAGDFCVVFFVCVQEEFVREKNVRRLIKNAARKNLFSAPRLYAAVWINQRSVTETF